MNLSALGKFPLLFRRSVSFEKSQTKAVGKAQEAVAANVATGATFSTVKTMKKPHTKTLSFLRNRLSGAQCAKRAHAETARCERECAEYPVGGSARSRHFCTAGNRAAHSQN